VDVGGRTLRFRNAVIATGARASVPPIPGLAEAGYLTNETVFDLTELPRRLTVIGAGPIGCELAQAFARFGAPVTLLDTEARVLAREDPDAAARVQAALVRDGVRLLLGSTVKGVERTASGDRRLHVEGAGGSVTVAADTILVGVGRAPNVEGLGLEHAGVQYDVRTGVRVNDRLQTTNRRIFAAGDVCSPLKFTHNSDFQARVVIQNALFLGRARASRLVVPWCTYTDPEVAHVGLSGEDAEKRRPAVQTISVPLSEVDRAVLDDETEGFVKVHHERGRLLGCTIVAAHAGEIIGQVSYAMVRGATLNDFASTVYPYPTQSEALRKAGDAYRRTRLTPRVRRAFERYFRITRW
jgi:pyruvate/2-oxoglutarate dehydrogenase complex dihydrolipoamide dehydrogenase (E3) component